MRLSRAVTVIAAIAFGIGAPLGAGAAASSSSPASTGTIAGTVTGVDEVPIAHACVSTWGSTSAAGTPTVVYTDDTGYYALTGLAASVADDDVYSVSVDASCGSDPLDIDYLEFSATSGLVYADRTTKLDARLTLGGSISGRVTDIDGVALKHICVIAIGPGYRPTASSDDGTFLVHGVPAGSYVVGFEDCSGTADVQAQYYGGGIKRSDAPAVNVVAGETLPLDDQKLLPGGQIAIKVGDPISGLTPFVYPVDPMATDLYWDTPSRKPDADGYFHFTNLLSMSYYIVYWYCPPGGACRNGVVGYFDDRSLDDGPDTIMISSGDVMSYADDKFVVPPVYPSTVSVETSAASIAPGQNVTFTAHLSDGADGPTPTGMVRFEEGGSALTWSGIASDGNAYFTTSALAVGTHTISVYYDGDGESSPSQGQVTITVAVPSTGGGGGGAPPAPSPVSGTVPAGGSLSSDPVGTTPDASDPLVVGITSPTAGTVTIDKTPPDTAISHYRVLNVGATITAPAASTSKPLQLSFQVFDGKLPAGSYSSDLTVFRDGVAVGPCATPGTVSPDPCVTSSGTRDGVTTIDVLSSHASTWDVEAADVGRIGGADRIATAVAVSRDSFPGGNAGAVVLTRADDFPDALVGAPLAVAKNAPILLTQAASLPQATVDELQRVLPQGGTAYLLGGPVAIPDAVATQLEGLGYHAVRYGGADRYATAVAVADALGDPSTVFLASGRNFPDALAAGPAAAHVHGAVLLTDDDSLTAATSGYLAAHATTTYAVGGPAAAADPNATPADSDGQRNTFR